MTRQDLSSHKLVYALTIHPELGCRIEAFSVMLNPDRSFSIENNRITPHNISTSLYELTDTDIKIIKLIDEYSEQSIVNKYSKKIKKYSEFIRKECDIERIEKLIQPYVNRKLNNILQIFTDENIPLYYKGRKQDYIHDKEIKLLKDKVEVIFNFTRNKLGLKYSLSIREGEKVLNLYKKSPVFLSNEPVRLLIDNTIYSFSDEFDRKKLQPFLNNEFILVPKKIEEKFFQTFFLKTLSKYDIEASGFTVEKEAQEFIPYLKLHVSWQTGVYCALEFHYPDKIFFPGDTNECTVKMVVKKDEYSFLKKIRNRKREKEIIHILESNGLKYSASGAFIPEFLKVEESQNENETLFAVVNWLNSHKELLQNAGIIIDQNYKGKKYFTDEIKIDFRLKAKIDWFDIYAVVSFGNYQVPLVKLRKNIVYGIREFELPDGSIAILPEYWFNDYKSTLLFAREHDGNMQIDKKLYKLLKTPVTKDIDSVQQKKDFNSLLPAFKKLDVSSGFTGKLRSYQAIGYSWLFYLSHAGLGCCLADDMGLGKTIQTLAILQKEHDDFIESNTNNAEPESGIQLDLFNQIDFPGQRPLSLIVMPTSLIHNWVNEIKKFAPELKYYVHSGMKRAKNNYSFRFYDLILTSYGLVRNDHELFCDFEFNYIVLDESQVIKNPESKVFESVIQLNSKGKIILTGTPIENSLSDLWSQFRFINPGLLGEINYFKKEFILPIEKNGLESRREKLKELIAPFILRRKKQEVESELPSLTETIRYCQMTDEQSMFYEIKKSEIRNFIFKEIESTGVEKKMFIVLKALIQLRLISNHPVLVDKNYPYDSGKFRDIIYLLDDIRAGNHKTLIYSSFVKHLTLFSDFFLKNNIPFEMLTGRIPENKRGKIFDRFQNEDDKKIFLISLKAGGLGLNLTAADYVFILDPWWNPAVEMQAINRAHRIGQDKKVFGYKFITKDTIEEKILLLQERKRILAEEFISSNNPLRALNVNDIKDLFE